MNNQIKIILSIILIVIGVFVFLIKNNDKGNLYSKIDPTGRYKYELVMITERLNDFAIDIRSINYDNYNYSIPPESFISMLKSDRGISTEDAINLLGNSIILEENIGPWSKDGEYLDGKIINGKELIVKYRIWVKDQRIEFIK